MSLAPIRSYLYVPGSNPHMIERALASQADALVLDLEDAVAPQQKDQARTHVAEVLQAEHAKPLFVRINALTTGLAERDLVAIAGPGLAGVRLPKVESADAVLHVAGQLALAGCEASIDCLIESARGVEAAFSIACAHSRVRLLGLGEADLAADLGVSDDAGFAYARSRIVVAARAAHLSAPVQSVYPHVRDLEGLRHSTEMGKRLGFFGRSLIHPSQIAIVHEIFTPTSAEITDAQALMDRLDKAVAMGVGALALEDGRFVDLAIVERARRTLALAQQFRKGTDTYELT